MKWGERLSHIDKGLQSIGRNLAQNSALDCLGKVSERRIQLLEASEPD
ncbi:MAG: hypothetical protein ABIS51_02835 [Sphingomonas sp.]